MWMTTTKTTTDDGAWVYYTEKVIRGRLIFFLLVRKIKYDQLKLIII